MTRFYKGMQIGALEPARAAYVLQSGTVIMTLVIAAPAGPRAWERVSEHGALSWWLAGPLIAASLHVFEEFVYPGGFREWYAGYRPEIASSLSVRYLVIVNAIMLAYCGLIAVAGPSPNGVANWFVIISILFWNAIFHIWAAVRMRRYSPGVITGIVLYIPLAVLGSFNLLQHRLVPWKVALGCFGIGSLYHVFSLRNHRRRAKAQAR